MRFRSFASVAALCALSCTKIGPAPKSEPTATAQPTAATPSPSASAAAPKASPYGPLPPLDPTNVGFALPGDDICDRDAKGRIKNAIRPGSYKGILRNAKCDQQKFVTMAYMCQELEIAGLVKPDDNQCYYCHERDPNSLRNPSVKVLAKPTHKKDIANWMLATFVDGLRRVDGKPMQCKGCHNDGKGHGKLKILGVPRDSAFAQEWMNEVMTASFVERRGKRLRCKVCHAGMAPNQPGWSTNVILQLEPLPNGCIRRFGFEPED